MIPIMQNSFESLGNTTVPPIILPSNNPPLATDTLTIDFICNYFKPNTAFPITVTGNNPQPSSFHLATFKSQIVSLGPGSFAVTQDTNGIPPYYIGDCKGTISAGQNLKCSIGDVQKR